MGSLRKFSPHLNFLEPRVLFQVAGYYGRKLRTLVTSLGLRLVLGFVPKGNPRLCLVEQEGVTAHPQDPGQVLRSNDSLAHPLPYEIPRPWLPKPSPQLEA